MTIYDVYLNDPKMNPFVARPNQPVFKGLEAESEEQVKIFWEEFRVTDQKFTHMTIDKIVAVK